MRPVESRQDSRVARAVVDVEQLAIHIFTIMTRRRRSSALPPGNLCYSGRQSQAYPSQLYCKSIIRLAPISVTYSGPATAPTPS